MDGDEHFTLHRRQFLDELDEQLTGGADSLFVLSSGFALAHDAFSRGHGSGFLIAEGVVGRPLTEPDTSAVLTAVIVIAVGFLPVKVSDDLNPPVLGLNNDRIANNGRIGNESHEWGSLLIKGDPLEEASSGVNASKTTTGVAKRDGRYPHWGTCHLLLLARLLMVDGLV